jgi:predicted SnoaL-like aldol condensation-catalyzing enzyme
MTDDTERNRTIVLTAFAEFAKGNLEHLRDVIAADFVEHSPGNPSGRDAFVDFLRTAPVAGATLDLKRVVADGAYVVLHYRMTTPDAPRGVAVADIWRLADGLIAEHWDVVQPVPDDAETPHGMF